MELLRLSIGEAARSRQGSIAALRSLFITGKQDLSLLRRFSQLDLSKVDYDEFRTRLAEITAALGGGVSALGAKAQDYTEQLLSAELLLTELTRHEDAEFLTIGSWFLEALHTDERCQVLTFDSESLDWWTRYDLGQEFAVWGIENIGTGRVSWRLLMESSLDYPFSVAKLRFEEDVHTGDGKRPDGSEDPSRLKQIARLLAVYFDKDATTEDEDAVVDVKGRIRPLRDLMN